MPTPKANSWGQVGDLVGDLPHDRLDQNSRFLHIPHHDFRSSYMGHMIDVESQRAGPCPVHSAIESQKTAPFDLTGASNIGAAMRHCGQGTTQPSGNEEGSRMPVGQTPAVILDDEKAHVITAKIFARYAAGRGPAPRRSRPGDHLLPRFTKCRNSRSLRSSKPRGHRHTCSTSPTPK